MYGSWEMERHGQNFFVILKKLKNWKKKPGGIIILHKSTKNHDHMLHCSWDTTRDGCHFNFYFGLFFALLRPITTQKIKIKTRINWLSLFYLYSPRTSRKKSEKSLEPFLRKVRYQPTNQPNTNVSDFGLIWRLCLEYLQIKNFFQKSGSVIFLPL